MTDQLNGFEALMRLYLPIKDLLLLTLLCSLRLLAAFLLLPPMSEKFLPGMLRMAIVSLIAFFIAFGTPVHVVQDFGMLQLMVNGLREVAIGLALGFAGAKVFWIAQCVGALVDNQSGFNNIQLSNPLSTEQTTPVSDFLLHFVTVLFFSMGGMLVFLDAVFASFKIWPLGQIGMGTLGNAESFINGQISGMMVAILKFAAPLLLVLLLIDIGFGLITRSASKLEISNLSQPIKGAVTILLLALMVATVMPQIKAMLLPTGLLESMGQNSKSIEPNPGAGSKLPSR